MEEVYVGVSRGVIQVMCLKVYELKGEILWLRCVRKGLNECTGDVEEEEVLERCKCKSWW